MAEENVGYAFNWLTANEGSGIFEAIKQHVQAANPILGELEFEIQVCSLGADKTEMPQKYASAWSGVKDLVGASYKPLMTIGKQQAKGTNYWFIAKQTLATATPETHIVTIGINEFEGDYKLIKGSIVKIF